MVKLVEGSRDPVTPYRCSRLALVPAGRATGFKATILQAWLCGTPVVASTASAATVEQRNLAALAVADSPEHMARLVLGLWDDSASLDRLARNGKAAAEIDHDDASVLGTWRQLVISAASVGIDSISR